MTEWLNKIKKHIHTYIVLKHTLKNILITIIGFYGILHLLLSHSLMSNSFQPHGLQHTRLPCPSPSPRACSNLHPLSQWKVLVSQSCPTLCNPMDYCPSGSSVYGILQATILEWVVILFSRGSSQSRDQMQISCTVGRLFTAWARKPLWVSDAIQSSHPLSSPSPPVLNLSHQ